MNLDFDRKYSKIEINQMGAVDVYRLVLNGKHVRTFPRGFWQRPEAQDNMIKVTKYLIEDILNIAIEDLSDCNISKLIQTNKLSGMYQALELDPFVLLEAVYPGKFKPWELKYLNKDYWTDNNSIKCVKWLIEEKLKWSDEEIKANLTSRTFKDNGLYGLIRKYGTDTFKFINLAYPDRFKPWELLRVEENFWDEQNTRKAIKWLIEDKLKYSTEDIINELTIEDFIDNRLVTIVKKYNYSVYSLVDLVYPNKFNPWEFKRVPKDYWDKETVIEAVKWLIEEKLKIKDLNSIYNIKRSNFTSNGLISVVKYKDYVILLKEVYPELDVTKFKNINYLTQHKIKEMNMF